MVRDLSESEFIDLIDSGKFRVKTIPELLDEGWEENDGELSHKDEDIIIEENSVELLEKLVSSDHIEEVDISTKSFKVNYYWFPMSIIDYSDFTYEPIKLNIPDIDEFLNI